MLSGWSLHTSMRLGLPLVKLPMARKGLRVQQHALLWSAWPATPLSSASCRLPWCTLFFLASYLWSCYSSPHMHFLLSLPNNLQFAFNFRRQVLILVASVSFFPSPCAPACTTLLLQYFHQFVLWLFHFDLPISTKHFYPFQFFMWVPGTGHV